MNQSGHGGMGGVYVYGRALVVAGAGTATGRKGSMWAAVPAAAACEATAAAAAADLDADTVPLGPGQLPPRNAMLAPLHAEINISIIMIKGQLELEVCPLYRITQDFIGASLFCQNVGRKHGYFFSKIDN